ncbi:MAG TPA: M24 family metallopeptidase [Candidatus Polarisedimenticolia bacterium]|nr:M24 family metallopeptidase [Candidatus Polarisedimenticolia bacterium]
MIRIDHAAIRRDRINTILPRILEAQKTDLWLTITRENTPDPILSVFGLDHIVARGAFLFARSGGRFVKKAIAASYDTDPIKKTGIFDEVVPYLSEGIKPHLKEAIDALAPGIIAVNVSRDVTIADGLTAGMRAYLEETLGADRVKAFVSAERIIVSLVANKQPDEIAALEHAVKASQTILGAALTPEKVRPGVTTERALADQMAAHAKELGCGVAFESVVVGPQRGHSEPTDRVIQHGDIIRIDWGATYEGYCADIQRMAYVTKPGETGAPQWLHGLFEATLKANRACVAAMKPGARGVDVDTAGRKSLLADGFEEYPHGSGHPIGLKVHDVGPMLCPDWRERYGDGVFFTIEPDQVFAVEPLIYVKPDALDYELNTSLEEDVVVGPDGARYIGTPQTSLIVIR